MNARVTKEESFIIKIYYKTIATTLVYFNIHCAFTINNIFQEIESNKATLQLRNNNKNLGLYRENGIIKV